MAVGRFRATAADGVGIAVAASFRFLLLLLLPGGEVDGARFVITTGRFVVAEVVVVVVVVVVAEGRRSGMGIPVVVVTVGGLGSFLVESIDCDSESDFNCGCGCGLFTGIGISDFKGATTFGGAIAGFFITDSMAVAVATCFATTGTLVAATAGTEMSCSVLVGVPVATVQVLGVTFATCTSSDVTSILVVTIEDVASFSGTSVVMEGSGLVDAAGSVVAMA